MTVFDFSDHKFKGTYLRHLRDEAYVLEQWFRERGTPPEEIYDILDVFRYIGLCHITFDGMSPEVAEQTKRAIHDMIDHYRQQQGLPDFGSLNERKR